MTAIENAVTSSSDGLWTVITWVLLAAGIWFCFRTAIVQIRMVPEMFRSLAEKPSEISENKREFLPLRHLRSLQRHASGQETLLVWQ